ncbi:MAG: OmpA family protein [Hydrogenophaga sp.]|uniref:OmpA family protein n=1 Tax=Hydrogenophaga sp. TaxID=1904254 RepID=UPI00261CAE1C|nr:OmpA family protein [Hydrogenophaga sp.]MDM7944356.1 OmpA family protein [Hydrogenophaga sp.]
MNTIHRFALSLTALAVVAGCSTTTPTNVRLDQAREDFRTVQADPRSQNQAAAELRQATDALNAANMASNNREDLAQVNHLAYVASQRAAIVRETVRFKTAEMSVANAGAARTSAQLEARTLQADAAQRAAAEAQRAAAEARRSASAARTDTVEAQRQAAMAQERSRMLEARMAELNAKQTPRGTVVTLGDVLFDVDRSALRPGGLRMVDQLAEVLKSDPQRTVLVEGFTDSTGADAYNQTLSTERADAVRVALMSRGIASSRVASQGYGKAHPVGSNASAAGRQMNRRVEIVLSDESGQIKAR